MRLCDMQFKMPTTVMKLYKIRIITTPNIGFNGGFMPSYKVFCKYSLFYDSMNFQKLETYKARPHNDFTPSFQEAHAHCCDGSPHNHSADFDAEE